MFRKIAVVVAGLGAALALTVLPASAAPTANPYPVEQIGMLISFDHTASGPYVPDPVAAESFAVPFTIVTHNAGCTWTTVGTVPAPSSTNPLDGVVFSFTTRTFGFQSGGTYDPTTHTITFKYNGVNASVLCPTA